MHGCFYYGTKLRFGAAATPPISSSFRQISADEFIGELPSLISRHGGITIREDDYVLHLYFERGGTRYEYFPPGHTWATGLEGTLDISDVRDLLKSLETGHPPELLGARP